VAQGVADITGAEAIVRPMREVNMSEATVSLAWVPNQPSCLATGTGTFIHRHLPLVYCACRVVCLVVCVVCVVCGVRLRI
jgi:hypothetical protein